MSRSGTGGMGGSARQWEAHVRQMVRQGAGREQIIMTMTDANWPYDDAMNLLRKIASKERWRAAWMLIGGGALALASTVITVGSIMMAGPNGVILYGPVIFGVGLGIYGLIRLVKIRV